MQHESTFNFVEAVLAEAMRKRLMISVVYNSSTLTLAPHQVVLRNEALYVCAVNPHKSRRVDEDPALGYFKIEGLSHISLTEETFEPLPSEACLPAREDDRVIASID